MPVEFLSKEQTARYGRYQTYPNPEHFTRGSYPSPAGIQLMAQRRRASAKPSGAAHAHPGVPHLGRVGSGHTAGSSR